MRMLLIMIMERKGENRNDSQGEQPSGGHTAVTCTKVTWG